LIVYGTSGVLPLRTTLDYLHRNLMLGDVGRNYSELAASWLWLGALGGVWLWWRTRQRRAASTVRAPRPMNARRLHALVGL
ncbi:PepSY-associated TM helix domain-containing protein, partial [Acinetobacter baumannii]